jgi:hypothetical protein
MFVSSSMRYARRAARPEQGREVEARPAGPICCAATWGVPVGCAVWCGCRVSVGPPGCKDMTGDRITGLVSTSPAGKAA